MKCLGKNNFCFKKRWLYFMWFLVKNELSFHRIRILKSKSIVVIGEFEPIQVPRVSLLIWSPAKVKR